MAGEGSPPLPSPAELRQVSRGAGPLMVVQQPHSGSVANVWRQPWQENGPLRQWNVWLFPRCPALTELGTRDGAEGHSSLLPPLHLLLFLLLLCGQREPTLLLAGASSLGLAWIAATIASRSHSSCRWQKLHSNTAQGCRRWRRPNRCWTPLYPQRTSPREPPNPLVRGGRHGRQDEEVSALSTTKELWCLVTQWFLSAQVREPKCDRAASPPRTSRERNQNLDSGIRTDEERLCGVKVAAQVHPSQTTGHCCPAGDWAGDGTIE